MNPLLKIAYDYGCQKAVEDFEKSADWKSSLGKFVYKNPFAVTGASYGGLGGGIAGAMNAEEGHGLRGFLAGAAGGSLLGAAGGKLSQRFMDPKTLSNLRIAARVSREELLGKGGLKAVPVRSSTGGPPGVRMENFDDRMSNIFKTRQDKIDALKTYGLGAGAALTAGVAGGLGAGALSGANDKPWYQRMNPFG
jgi:hypothetical protein